MKKRPVERPKNLNLFTIRLPLNAVVSILHRLSGVALFLVLPLLVYVFRQSVDSEQTYQAVLHHFDAHVIKVLLVLISFAFFHHFYAGIRHLLQDVHWMTSLQKAKITGRLVFVLDAVSVLVFAWWLWS